MTSDERPTPDGMLAAVDRRYLRGEEEYNSRQGVHDRRKAIRSRIVNTILDFGLVFENLSATDRQTVVNEVMDETPDHSLMGGSVSAPSGVIAMLAFLYELHDDVSQFEQTIERGLGVALVHEQDASVVSVEANIDIKRVEDVNPDVVMEKVDEERFADLTPAEHQWIVRVLAANGNLSIEDFGGPHSHLAQRDKTRESQIERQRNDDEVGEGVED
jgi:hypothetical protein